jgi:hypothetical protein
VDRGQQEARSTVVRCMLYLQIAVCVIRYVACLLFSIDMILHILIGNVLVLTCTYVGTILWIHKLDHSSFVWIPTGHSMFYYVLVVFLCAVCWFMFIFYTCF